MSLASPLFLLALLAVPLVAVLMVVARRARSRNPVAFTNLAILAGVAPPRKRSRSWLGAGLLLLSLACAATALAQPRVNTTVPAGQAVVVILVDVSGSMDADDIAPNRIAAAITAMETFVKKLPPHARVGLDEFSTYPTTVVSPTTNHNTVLAGLGALTPGGATALGDGIEGAIRDVQTGLTAAQASQSSKPGAYVPGAIVLESDGAQNRGTLQPVQAAESAKRAGIRIYTVAFGTPRGTVRYPGIPTPIPVPPAPATMQAIARITGGKTYTAQTADEATNVYGHLGSTLARTHSRREITSWLSLGAGLLLVAAIGVGASLGPVLP